jgi:hypothetical protein
MRSHGNCNISSKMGYGLPPAPGFSTRVRISWTSCASGNLVQAWPSVRYSAMIAIADDPCVWVENIGADGRAVRVLDHENLCLGFRASRRLARFLIILGIGVGATLAWQSYGDAARAMIANSSPQLGWLAPQTAPIARTTPDVVAPAALGTASADVQQLALGLASMRQSVNQLTAQLEAGQRQMGGDIAKLQADEQEILHKLSAAPPRLAAAPAPKPAPVTPPPSASAQAR